MYDEEGELLLEAFGGIDIKYIAAWDDDINQMDVPYVNLKQILMSADELSVQSQNDKILLTLAYYTCATYFRGRKIAPPDAP